MNDISEYKGGGSIIEPEDDFIPEEDSYGSLPPTLEAGNDGSGAGQVKNVDTTSPDRKKLNVAVEIIDRELERLNAREVLSASEARDLLLDLRLELIGGSTKSGD